MKTVPQTKANPVAKAFCGVLGHKYKESRKVTNHISEYKCCHCGKETTSDMEGKLKNLTTKAKLVNDCLASFFEKKNTRILQ